MIAMEERVKVWLRCTRQAKWRKYYGKMETMTGTANFLTGEENIFEGSFKDGVKSQIVIT